MKSLKEIEKYAVDNFVPIIRCDNIKYLEKLIKDKKLYKILTPCIADKKRLC